MTQEQIKRQMEQNSADWHTASDEKKEQLHAANVALAAKLDALTGGTSTFSGSSGTWDLSHSGSSSPQYTSPTLRSGYDYSADLEQLYQAKTESALYDLKQAYESNVLDLDRTEQQLAPTYQAARNQTASAAAIEKKNFGEYAAAQGLGSGAAAQAELSRGVALQGNLNALNQSEASDRADLQMQRSKLYSEYQNAIAKAKATGNANLAASLYQEMVRLDEADRETQLNQANLDYKAYESQRQAQRDQISDAQWEHEQDRLAERDEVADAQWEREQSYKETQSALEWAYKNNQQAFNNAMSRWKTLGYLDAASAKVLGLPAGTRTSDYVYQLARIVAMRR
jgi:hypothetical protein